MTIIQKKNNKQQKKKKKRLLYSSNRECLQNKRGDCNNTNCSKQTSTATANPNALSLMQQKAAAWKSILMDCI
jgi:hypothetical protein